MAEPTTAELMIAITDLHAAMLQGFAQVDQRFERLETRVTSIEGEVKGIHRWMARVP